MNVYILREDDYEGNTIHGIFSSEEKAEEYKRKFDKKYAEVYDYDLDPLEGIPKDHLLYRVSMDDNNGFDVEKCSNYDYTTDTPEMLEHWKYALYYLSVYVWANDKEDAMDKAEAIKNEWLLTNEWKYG